MTTNIKEAASRLAAKLDPREALVGIGDGELYVYVTASKSIQKRLAVQTGDTFEGFPVTVKYVGEIRPAMEGT